MHVRASSMVLGWTYIDVHHFKTFPSNAVVGSTHLFKTLAIPKSPSLMIPDLVRNMFCVLMSLCSIFLSWTCLRPRQIWTNQFRTCIQINHNDGADKINGISLFQTAWDGQE